MAKIEITKSETIGVSGEDLWRTVGDGFADIASWASGVSSSAPQRGVPVPTDATVGGRVCEVPGFGNVKETFVEYSAEQMAFTYEAEADGLPGFVSGFRNSWSVEARGANRSILHLTIRANLSGIAGKVMGPIMKRKLSGALEELAADIKVYAETGSPSAEKIKAQKKLVGK